MSEIYIFDLYNAFTELLGEDSFQALDYDSIILQVDEYFLRVGKDDFQLIEKAKELAKKIGETPKIAIKKVFDLAHIIEKQEDKLANLMARKFTKKQLEELKTGTNKEKITALILKSAVEWGIVPGAVVGLVATGLLPYVVAIILKGITWAPFLRRIGQKAWNIAQKLKK